MNVQQSLVLGVIQGLTEFLPVSSTAHLILAQKVFSTGFSPRYPHTYFTIIQIGTLLPVLVYFWQDWLRLLQAARRIVLKRRLSQDPEERMVKYLLLGSLPAGLAGLALEDQISRLAEPSNQAAYLYVGIALIGVGLLMWWAEAVGRKHRTLEHLRTPDALLVGLAQALALFPGVSRSGSTITAGMLVGLTREAAARFSFLLMTPIMLAATLYKLLKLVRGVEPMTGTEWGEMLLATAIAAVTGYAAIAFLLGWLRTRSLGFFVVYRLLVGGFCIGLFLLQ